MTIFHVRPLSAWRTTMIIAAEHEKIKRPSYVRLYLIATKYRALHRALRRENDELRAELAQLTNEKHVA